MEGITNSIFKKEDVEEIAKTRLNVCQSCPLYDEQGDACFVPGTEPCCNKNLGGCGCSLKLKIRSLSSSCPKDKWLAELSQEEEDLLNQKLGL